MTEKVFIAKNGRPYVKDMNGKVKFISEERAQEIIAIAMKKELDLEQKTQPDIGWAQFIIGLVIIGVVYCWVKFNV